MYPVESIDHFVMNRILVMVTSTLPGKEFNWYHCIIWSGCTCMESGEQKSLPFYETEIFVHSIAYM